MIAFLSKLMERGKKRTTTHQHHHYHEDMPELSLSYRQFRERFPLARIVFEEPLFLSIASGVDFLPKVNDAMQMELAQGEYEETLKEAWIANLNQEEVFIAYDTELKYWYVVGLEELKKGKYDLTRVAQFKPYEISLELKRLIVYHHQLLMDIGINMAKNSAKTILSIKSEQNGYNLQEQKDRKQLTQELASYTSDKVLLTSNGSWSTVSVNTTPLLEIRRNILQSIASITSIPMEILEQGQSNSVFTGESDSSRRYKNYVRSMQHSYLYPIYLLTLANYGKWKLIDPFSLTQKEILELERRKEEIIKLRIENHRSAKESSIDESLFNFD